MEEIVHQGEVAGIMEWDAPLESEHTLLSVENQDHQSPGTVARILRRLLPDAWIERTAIGKVHSEIKLDPEQGVDLEEGEPVEVVLRRVESG